MTEKITQAILDDLTAQAKASPRLRMNLDLRNSADDTSQRMLNAIEPGSVVPIHRHRKSSETVVCLRGRLVEEWSTTKNGVRTVQPYQLSIPYIVSDLYNGSGANQAKWFDNRASDYCFYYATPVYSTGTSEIDLIGGVDASSIDLGVLPIDTQINILFETDAVQVNRSPQYWGLDKLPWTGSSADTHTGVTPADDVSLPATP